MFDVINFMHYLCAQRGIICAGPAATGNPVRLVLAAAPGMML